ncbi:fibroblast growth factor receptor-like 1 [Episyrphus balteatus]|uniref:fibroblast growth factor receptor-like 1 n=1 Tax=Episyrphus balteatus TaxID=286459 RepID=UPI002485F128|nr:fibroblast growth factor receptor-like 1 [Episyrphus balteatus]XP_055848326.1 fibroblast growth factor receptor-like 1 [Episyrphus balteatus]XP_055848327.1 fibroblast growth factor receptor-like 1 [Episyrphus balteatus]
MIIERSLLLHFIFWINTVYIVDTSYIDYSENTELIQQRAGNDIQLNCGIRGLLSEHPINGMQFNWYFKPCGDDSYQKSCHSVRSETWSHLPCDKNYCQSLLHLKNLTEKDSGLYKCTIYPYKLDDVTTLDIQLVRTYQLDVKNSTELVPEFLDGFPENKTAAIGSQVVFQCRVQSQVHPTIKWFKRIPDIGAGMEYNLGQENFNSHIVQYNGGIYELLQTAREKNVDDEIYLSKLILNGIRSQDEGFYACVAISYRGHRIREAFLRVEDYMDYQGDEGNYWEDYDASDEGPQPKSFWMFFLMPLGLAMIPILIWLCYVVNKKKSHDNLRFDDEEQSLQ